jgi:transposase
MCDAALRRCVPDPALDPFDDAACAASYDQHLSDVAAELGVTISHGIGIVDSLGSQETIEVGVVYGTNGEFGCFETRCGEQASTSGGSGVAFYNVGLLDAWESFAGPIEIRPGEASIPFLTIGLEAAQIWSPGLIEQRGALGSASTGASFLPTGTSTLTCDVAVNEIVCPAESLADSDGDGTADCFDSCPADPAKTEKGACECGVAGVDSDDDGTADCADACPEDPAKTSAGECGCGNPDVDTDADGWADCVDECPDDALKNEPGLCGCGMRDDPEDTDADGIADCRDVCPLDVNKGEPGMCGCGAPDPRGDSLGPVLICENARAECAGPLTPVATLVSAADSCGKALLASVSDGGPYPLGATPVTWSATDAENRTATCEATARVVDTTKPTALCEGDTQECGGPRTAVNLICTGSDLCDPDLEIMSSARTSYEFGKHSFSCTATDASGNTDTTLCEVRVVDTRSPAAACQGAVKECTGPLTRVSTECSGSDVCDDELDTYSTAASSYQPGVHPFDCTVTDDAGNTDTASCNVVVVDTLRPNATCRGDVQECTGPMTRVSTSCTGADTCDSQVDARSTAAAAYPRGTSRFECSVTDDAGNVDTASCDVVVRDTTPPDARCRGDIRECAGALTPVLTSCSASDLCDGSVDTRSTAAPAYPLGASSFVCAATDDAGNTDMASCNVVVTDTLRPQVECAGETVECSGSRSAHATVTGAASDICDSEVRITGTGTTHYSLGSHAVTVTGTDESGNATPCTATVVVRDTAAPRITATPGDDVYACGEPYVEHGASAFDVCDGDISAAIVIDSADVATSTPTSTQHDPLVVPYVVHYAVTDGSDHRTATTREVAVLRHFGGRGGIMWQQPLPPPASGSEDTDPSGFMTDDPADDYRFAFNPNRTIPVKIRLLDLSGADVTADHSVTARIAVYPDADCDRDADGGAMNIDYNGIGGPGGMMRFDGSHLHYNLATKNWPGKQAGCFILEATARVSGHCNDIHTERVWLQRRR